MEIIKLKKVSNLLLVDFKLGREKLIAVVDSGCSHTMICETKILSKSNEIAFYVDGVNGRTEHTEAVIPQLSLGKKNGIVKNISVISSGKAVMERLTEMVYGEESKKQSIHAIIGTDIFCQIDAILDFKSLTLTLRK